MTTNLHDKMLAAIDAYFSASDAVEEEVAENLLLDVRDEILKQPAQQEPVAFDRIKRGMEILMWNRAQAKPPIEITKEQWVANELERFYTPQAQPAREPLTDERILSCPYDNNDMRSAFSEGWLKAEAAHGITKGNT